VVEFTLAYYDKVESDRSDLAFPGILAVEISKFDCIYCISPYQLWPEGAADILRSYCLKEPHTFLTAVTRGERM